MNKEVEAFVDKFIFPVAHKFECDVEMVFVVKKARGK